MSKMTIQLCVDFDTLQWLDEIGRTTGNVNKKNIVNRSKALKEVHERYLFMVFELDRLKRGIEKPAESYETVRTEQIKQQQQQEKPLHEQGNPGFFKKYRNINEWFKEKGFVEQEGDKTG